MGSVEASASFLAVRHTGASDGRGSRRRRRLSFCPAGSSLHAALFRSPLCPRSAGSLLHHRVVLATGLPPSSRGQQTPAFRGRGFSWSWTAGSRSALSRLTGAAPSLLSPVHGELLPGSEGRAGGGLLLVCSAVWCFSFPLCLRSRSLTADLLLPCFISSMNLRFQPHSETFLMVGAGFIIFLFTASASTFGWRQACHLTYEDHVASTPSALPLSVGRGGHGRVHFPTTPPQGWLHFWFRVLALLVWPVPSARCQVTCVPAGSPRPRPALGPQLPTRSGEWPTGCVRGFPSRGLGGSSMLLLPPRTETAIQNMV